MFCLQFPEHGFYQLQHRILLFHHDVSDNNILRLINGSSTTVDDIRENSLVEVVLSGLLDHFDLLCNIDC